MAMIDHLKAELEHEAALTTQVLQRTPDRRFDWQPHPKSMTLGRLACHIAETPGWMAGILDEDELRIGPESYKPFVAASTEDLVKTFQGNVSQALESMIGRSDEHLGKTWRMVWDGQVAVEQPRFVVVRTFVLSHLIHHRGQFTVYLRLNDVPLPAIYGPSADEK
jgi:uncharacterized damage-inducible protein DinB